MPQPFLVELRLRERGVPVVAGRGWEGLSSFKGFLNAHIICEKCQSDWLIQLDLTALTNQTDSLRK